MARKRRRGGRGVPARKAVAGAGGGRMGVPQNAPDAVSGVAGVVTGLALGVVGGESPPAWRRPRWVDRFEGCVGEWGRKTGSERVPRRREEELSMVKAIGWRLEQGGLWAGVFLGALLLLWVYAPAATAVWA